MIENVYGWQERTLLLMGEEAMQRLRDAHVLVVGAGGVGGYALEMLARAGIGRLTIVDSDEVQESNRNRQIIATCSTVGKSKVDLWKERIEDIAPECVVRTHRLFLKDELTEELLDAEPYTFVIDAIDTLSPKVFLIASLQRRSIPFISAMGAGSKYDPTKLRVGDMKKVGGCPLSRVVRKRLRKLGVSVSFPVVYSEELPDKETLEVTDGENNKKSVNGTVAYLPAVAGCYAAYYAVKTITQKEENK
ncbi:MAG: tRNA threonylcarbamoyladenosine dehydratase [Porphyromonas sp.]|nr:tRNA threonylcarbamoyladenosine dehydratase [Porphyromonas sp.]